MTELVRYEAARRALAEAKRIDEVKDVKDKTEALRLYAIQKKDTELETLAAEIKFRAERRIGELSRDLPKSGGPGRGKRLPSGGKSFKGDALREAGISTSQAHRCEQIAQIPEADFEGYIATKRDKGQAVSAKELVQMTGKKTRRKAKVDKLKARNAPLPTGEKRYPVILADPPWQYHNVLSDSRLIENQYPTMGLEAIKALPVAELAAPDSVLYLWSTSPGLEEALSVLNAWGFTYRSCAVWVKPSIGAGYWFRQQHELLLLGARGEIPVPSEAARPSSVIEAPRGAHSEKPAVVHELIERAFPEFERIELFARSAREGWAAWGNQADAA